MNLNFDIGKIEEVLANAVRTGNVTEKVFKGQRPNVEAKMNDFAIVSVATRVTDRGALGRCTCRIELFVKNLSNGEKNSTKQTIMYEKLLSIFPIQDNTYLFDIYPVTIPLGNDGYGYNIIAIQFHTHIKTL
ncbi:hypothetical protein [Dysgonomonas sp. 25]|uniref:hypothetical protein n=1 Tax=Dysgonomonas sp. 25 TaxID=2302933 RepID=UPI0013D27AD1|nr:hypothetical protein [Dysgonomonas sp. 25]NDV68596.1 hypothetical protein [Dysgonomonas sp. 25]